MYQGVGMLSFNSYSLINIRFLINKGGVIWYIKNRPFRVVVMDIFVCVARTENPTLFFTVKNVH